MICDKSATQGSVKTLNTSLRDLLPWLMPQLTAKDKTHPSHQSGPFLSNNAHNGVLQCRYCVNNLNSDLGYWALRSQPQYRPSRWDRAWGPLFAIFFCPNNSVFKDLNLTFPSNLRGVISCKDRAKKSWGHVEEMDILKTTLCFTAEQTTFLSLTACPV